MRVRKRYWEARYDAVKERLRTPLWWYPFPLVISFALVLLLTAHVLFGINPRAGNPADVIVFPAESQKDSALWLSVTPLGDEIVVTTADRRIFRWRQDIRAMTALAPLIEYLKERAAVEIKSAVLAERAVTMQVRAVIAADQRLKFLHIRPLLHALAEAGISQYGFETQNPVVAGDARPAAPGGGDHHGG